MSEAFDIAIIGGGPGGYSTALRAAELGKRVAMIERDATLGGTCLNRGCIPSKALISATHAIDSIRHAGELGISATINGIDYGTLHDYKKRIVDTMTQGLAGLLAHRGVTVFRGVASITGAARPITVHIAAPADGQGVQRSVRSDVPEDIGPSYDITAQDVVLAMGSVPRQLPGEPFRGAIIDSTRAMSMAMPHNAVIIGAGAIAAEFASMWNAAGCKVTMLIRKDRVLSGWDRRAGVTLTHELKRHGIDVINRSTVTHIDTGVNMGALVHYTSAKDGGSTEHIAEGEFVLVAIGRDPLTSDGWIRDAGVTVDDHGFITTDGYGRTPVAGIWAVGDITEGHALAHRAFEQGIIAAESIAGLDPKPLDEDTIPQIVFSNPEAASVGLTATDAKQRDDLSDIKETVYPMMSNARMMMSDSGGSLSLVSGICAQQPGVRVVLGVHMVAPVASDIIAEAEQLVGNHTPLSDAARLIHPHPTFSETLGETLLKADDRPLHTR